MQRIAFLLLIASLVGCGQKADAPSRERAAPEMPEAATPAHFSVAGMSFAIPPAWEAVTPSSPMRKASFRFEPVAGDEQAAEMHVFHFGADQGGSVEANIRRWLGQMSDPAGGSIEDLAQRESFRRGELPAHLVRVDGTFADSVGGPMSGQTVERTGWRLVAAIVEGPRGSVFFKMTGPQATVREMEKDLVPMLEHAPPGSGGGSR